MTSPSGSRSPRARAGTTTRPTLRMVAAEAGVSIATVSYVLSGRVGRGPGVRDDTIERVRAAAKKLDYHPNQAARAMRTGRTNTVLLSLTMLSDPWSQAVAAATATALKGVGVTPLILADGDWRQVLSQQGTDAAFIDGVPDTLANRRQLASLSRRGDRLVVFSETITPNGFDVIRSVDQPGIVLATRHLAERFETVGCLTNRAADGGSSGWRYSTFVETMTGLDRTVAPEHVENHEAGSTGAYEAALRLLGRDDRPRAVLAVTDYVAIAAVNAALRLGLRVPEDVAVMGVGNTLEGERMNPTLSSVGPTDFFDRLAEIIRDRATGADTSEPTVHDFPWQLHLRETTAA